MYSIRVKITAIMVAAILVSILCVFGAYTLTIRAENDRSSVEMMNLIAQSTRKSLGKYFESIEQSIEMTANIASDALDSVVLAECGAAGADTGLAARTPEQIRELDEYLADYCAGIRDAFASVASHTYGVVSYYYCINPEISAEEHGFFYSKVGKTGFEEQPPLDVKKLGSEDMTWYYTPLKRGRPSWIGPYTTPILNNLETCSYIVPIYKAGSLIGILGMDIPFETLVAQIRPIRVYNTGFACLCDDKGYVLYHPNLEYGTVPEISELDSVGEMFQDEDSGDSLIRYTVEGQERQMAYSTLSTGMKLVVTAPTKEISASIITLVRNALIITAGISLFFVVAMSWVLRIITRPLQQLTDASRRLAAGDYEVELSYQRRDEIGTLTRSFMHMRDKIRLYIDDLNRRVLTDALTGLPNMRYFFKLAENEKARLSGEGKTMAVVYFNLIGMKHFNRQYGFEEGDSLIRAVADILTDQYGDLNVSRISQDNYAAVTSEEDADKHLEQVFRECGTINEGRTLPVQAGVYSMRFGDVDISIACDRAKFACDRNRGAYVSGACFFDEKMLKQIENVPYIINHLDQAVREGWIRVFYQPIIRAQSGKVCDEEALSRWIDPERGMLSPDDFIPVLEKAKLIYILDLFVLDRILEKMRDQKAAGLRVVPQSLNLSREDFESCDIVEEICRRVDRAGIPHSRLTIEVMESVVGSDFEFMKSRIERFRKLGFPVWMDDFGSGYSSLDMLQQIHFDLIKFDMRFLQRFEDGKESRIILTELIRMAVGLGIETLAEGVETKEQADFLRNAGCTKLQGYYYCKPIPPEEILERNRKGIQIGFEEQDSEDMQ